MNKNVKKTLLFVAILILVIVIISAVYLLLLAPGGDNGETPTPSGSVSATVSPSPSESAAVQSETPSPAIEWYTREETADGTIFHATVPGELVAYSVTVDERVFDLTDTGSRMQFRSNADKGHFVEFSFVAGAKAAELAPSYLDSYLDYMEFEQSGKEYVGDTEISGEAVTVNDGKTQLEAWLIDTEKGVLAIVISYSLPEKEVQRAELKKMLDTLVIKES